MNILSNFFICSALKSFVFYSNHSGCLWLTWLLSGLRTTPEHTL